MATHLSPRPLRRRRKGGARADKASAAPPEQERASDAPPAREAKMARPAAFAPRSVRRALLVPQVNPGSLYRRGRST